MRLMCSQNQAEVESVRSELLKAGINVEVRNHPLAERLGVRGIELWVPQERDFVQASRLYEKLQERSSGDSETLGSEPPTPTPEPIAQAEERTTQEDNTSTGEANCAPSSPVNETGREELKQASALLQKGLDEMFRRETELSDECTLLRSKVEELTQALDHALSALANETEARASIEKVQAEQISGLVNALEAERQDWRQKYQALEKQLASHKELEQQMEAHVLSLSSLCGRKVVTAERE